MLKNPVVFDHDRTFLKRSAANDLVAAAVLVGQTREYDPEFKEKRAAALDQINEDFQGVCHQLMDKAAFEKTAEGDKTLPTLVLALAALGGTGGALAHLSAKRRAEKYVREHQGLPGINTYKPPVLSQSILESILKGALIGGVGGAGIGLTVKGLKSALEALNQEPSVDPVDPNESHTGRVLKGFGNRIRKNLGFDVDTAHDLTEELKNSKIPISGAAIGGAAGASIRGNLEYARAIREGLSDLQKFPAGTKRTKKVINRAAKLVDYIDENKGKLFIRRHRNVLPRNASLLRKGWANIRDVAGSVARFPSWAITKPFSGTYLGGEYQFGRAAKKLTGKKTRNVVSALASKGKYRSLRPRLGGGLAGSVAGWLVADALEKYVRELNK